MQLCKYIYIYIYIIYIYIYMNIYIYICTINVIQRYARTSSRLLKQHWCRSVAVYIYIYIYISTYIYIYIYIHTYTHMYVYVCVYIPPRPARGIPHLGRLHPWRPRHMNTSFLFSLFRCCLLFFLLSFIFVCLFCLSFVFCFKHITSLLLTASYEDIRSCRN